jgi:hypothetical protein
LSFGCGGGGLLYCKFVSAQSFSIGVKEIRPHVPSLPSAPNVLAMRQSSRRSLRKSTLELVMSQHSVQRSACVYLDYCDSQTDKHKQKT